MSKLTRATQQIFGSAAGANQIAQFGSLAADAPAFTTNPETIQALSNYLGGWYDAVIGANSPAIEDMNALHYLYAYQLAYLFQAGVAEWDDGTTYYIGSIVNNGVGTLYRSIVDNNLNNAVTDATKWAQIGGYADSNVVTVGASPVTVSAGYSNALFLVNSVTLGAVTFNLVAGLPAGFTFTIKDIGGAMSMNNATVARAASENIEGVGASYVCRGDYGSWTFVTDGTDWWLQ